MGATSVTGVGTGAADSYGAGNKGSERMSLGVHRLIGPRVVACGTITLSAATEIVYYPTLPGTASQYAAFLQGGSTTYPYVSAFTASSFAVTGSVGDVVSWVLVKQGLWGSLDNDGNPAVIANT